MEMITYIGCKGQLMRDQCIERVPTLHRHHLPPLVPLPLQTFDLGNDEKPLVYHLVKMNAFIVA